MAKKDDISQDITPETAGVVTGLTYDQLANLIRLAKGGGNDNSAVGVLAQTMERLVTAQERQAQATERQVRPSNADHLHISAFSYPEGDLVRPKPKLNAITIFEGVIQSEEQLTPLEIDLFNQITSAKTSRKGAWRADYVPSMAGSKPTLNIRLGVRNHDDLVGLPPLVQILTELSLGAEAADVTTLYNKLAQLQNELDAFKSGQAVAAATETVGA